MADDNNNDGGVLGRIGIRKRKQKWTHLKQTKHNVTVTIGETQESVWKQAQMEIKRLRKMLVERTGTKNPTIHQIINLLYGNESKRKQQERRRYHRRLTQHENLPVLVLLKSVVKETNYWQQNHR